MSEHTQLDRLVFWAKLLSLGAGVAILFMVILAGISAAQPTPTPDNVTQKAGYYNDSTGPEGVQNESWMEGRRDATLANTTAFSVRLVGFVVGNGNAAAAFVTSLIMIGVYLGIVQGTSLGSVGASTVSVVALTGLVSIGFAPMWLYALVLMGLGVVATVVIVRALQ